MSKTNDGGAAFPIESEGLKIGLRDWFAGQALAGLLANPEMPCGVKDFAECSYEYADAMLAERAKERE